MEGFLSIAYSTIKFLGDKDFSFSIRDYDKLGANFSMITGSTEMIFKKHKRKSNKENVMDNIIRAKKNNIVIKKINKESELIIVSENKEDKIKFGSMLDITTKLKEKVKNIF
jgi:predicted regulator of Ras-like GTPase activity (Roadblock/LC7/MglB family)